MRKLPVVLALVAVVAAAGGGRYLARHSAPAPAAPIAAPLPPPPATLPETAALPPATGGPAAAPAAAAAEPPPPAAPPLPTVAVAPHAIHDVPEQATPAAPAPPSLAALPMPGRGGPTPRKLSGAARPLGGVTLSLLGRPVTLFGVRAPEGRALCIRGSGPAQPCGEAARTALAERLGARPAVTCQSPQGQSRAPAYVCRDVSGTDLAGFLVSQGLALADTRQSYQYFNAESAARAARRGVWRLP